MPPPTTVNQHDLQALNRVWARRDERKARICIDLQDAYDLLMLYVGEERRVAYAVGLASAAAQVKAAQIIIDELSEVQPNTPPETRA